MTGDEPRDVDLDLERDTWPPRVGEVATCVSPASLDSTTSREEGMYGISFSK